MIFFGITIGGGVLAAEALCAMLASEGGTLQKGVLKMRTAPAPASKECVM